MQLGGDIIVPVSELTVVLGTDGDNEEELVVEYEL